MRAQVSARLMWIARRLFGAALLAAAFLLATPADAAAQACGGANEPPCTRQECAVHGLFGNCLIYKTIRTCDTNRLNLRPTLSGLRCVPCGSEGSPNCDTGPSCNASLRDVAGFCVACGGAGEIACSGGVCDAGTRNVAGICTACGSDGEVACSSGVCDAGTRNVLGICRACGSDGEVACDGGLCEAGTRNVLGFCRACGQAGQPACLSSPGCSGRTNLVGIGDAALCVACGGRFQPECTTDPVCDSGLNPIAGRCLVMDCGGDGQVQCSEEPRCDAGNEPFLENGFAMCFRCGLHGDRQCRQGPACLTEEDGQRHEPLLNPFGGEGLGFCFRCGGEDQQACRALRACDRPLHNILGFCKPVDPWVAEPDCNCSVPVPAAVQVGDPIWGFADVHAHQFANLGFGGVQFSGAPHDPDGITFALPGCGFTEDFATVGPAGNPTIVLPLAGVPVHGPGHALDLLGLAAGNTPTLSNFGVPPPLVAELPADRAFNGWPKWSSPNHQRMYYRWLERAWRGGLRFMIMQAVNNELSCRTGAARVDATTGQSFGCNDMAAVDRQLQAAKDLEAAIDAQHGGRGLGWYRIVTSPSQAREVMRSGKLAVVLGIEVDALFNCQRGACTETDVETQLQRYYDMGVRHAYPIHLFDNDFGGASYYFEAFNPGNLLATGHFFQAYDCSSIRYEFRGAFSNAQDFLLNFFADFFGFPLPLPSGHVADCNLRGLTPLGKFLVKRMMDRGMMIDLDHLSFRAVNEALTLAEEEHYPVMASHVYVADLHEGTDKGERKWMTSQLSRLRDLGGVVAPILIPENTKQFSKDGVSPVANDCKSSSKEWAQRYLAAVEQMSGSHYLVGVGYGSDFNGMTKGLAPRFGEDGCDNDPDSVTQQGGIAYPFAAHGMPGTTFDKQVTGGRTFDYNRDGVAHVGLIPDFIQDLKSIGLHDEQLEPFFRSAEAVLQMWERIGARGAIPPRTTATVAPEANAAGWHKTDVTVTLNAVAQSGVANIAYSAAGGATVPPTQTAGNLATVALAGDGDTTLSFSATDTAGNVEPQRNAVVRIDTVLPEVNALVSPSPNDTGWHKSNVTVTFQGVDNGSGMAQCDGPFQFAGEGPNFSASGRCTDKAGNASTVTEVEGIKIDRTPPVIAAATDLEPNANGWFRSNVRVSFTASDALSGVASTPADVIVSTDGEGQEVRRTAVDHAGNEAAAAILLNVDKTPPTIAGNRTPGQNVHGWNNSSVTVSFACTDGLSGLAAGSPPADTTLSGEAAGQSVTGTCIDRADNTATATEAHINIDRTLPTIAGTFGRSADSNGWYNHAVDAMWTCTDALSGIDGCSPTTTYNGPDSTTATLSGHTTDKAGNGASGSVSFRFDATPPAIELSSPPSGAVYLLNQTASASYSCSDNLSGPNTCIGSTQNGETIDTSTVGAKEFRVNATDVAGNTASTARAYNVRYVFEGFFQPVENLPVANIVNAGRTIPLKWRLKDAQSALVADPGSFVSIVSVPTPCDASASVAIESMEEVAETAVPKFTGDGWNYNWKTSSGWSDCRLLQLTLADGSQYTAKFQFR